jgi:hypothetical protein
LNWIKRLFLVVLLTPFFLIWGEVFTRTLLPQNVDSRMNIFAPDPVIGFTYKPNAKAYEKGREYNALYQTNSLGLRDREYGEKKEGICRMLLLGDSFSVSHGLPVEESLSRQLERAIQEVVDLDGLNLRIEVINAAAGGYSPYNYWKAYHRWAPVLKPNVVVVGFSPDDYDCSNAELKYLIEDGSTLAAFRDGQEPKRGGGGHIRKLRKWLSWNSEFYILMRNFFYYNDFVGRISMWVNAKWGVHQNQLQQYVVPIPESMKKEWGKTFGYLQNLRKETARDGVELVVIPIPLKMEVDPEEYQKTLSGNGLGHLEVDKDQPLKMISAFCKQEKIPVLDPRQALKERHALVPCYFVYDGHWIGEGIRVATVSMAKQWRDMGLPPWKKGYPELKNKGL